MPNTQTVRLLLRELAGGERQAFDQLIPLVYAELRRIAEAQLRKERSDHTLQPTALVNELYSRMVGREQIGFNDRAHFLAIAAQTMRRILIDHARVRNAAKRNRGQEKVSIDQAGDVGLQHPSILIALGDALEALGKQDTLMARLIELRYFGGLTTEESAVVVDLPVSEVRRELRLAQAWLRRELESADPAQGKSSSSA
jgi:RNA polymerase sigma factor (TIGR02999 family)